MWFVISNTIALASEVSAVLKKSMIGIMFCKDIVDWLGEERENSDYFV